jgi:MerR family transcriptional regulator, heat shock protein HspR
MLVQGNNHMVSLKCHIFPLAGGNQMDNRSMPNDDHKAGAPASDRGVYGISVTAELSGINEQSLRLYERQGLLTPARSPGGTRRYSTDDLVRLQRIRELVDAGVNIAGIARILGLEDRNAALEDRTVGLEGDNAALRAANSRRKSAKRPARSRSPHTDPKQSKPTN